MSWRNKTVAKESRVSKQILVNNKERKNNSISIIKLQKQTKMEGFAIEDEFVSIDIAIDIF